MGRDAKFRVKGIDKLRNRLARIKPSVERKHMRRAMLAAGGVIRDEAASRAPVRTGLLKRSYRVKYVRRRDGGGLAIIGPKQGMKRAIRRTRRGTFRAIGKKKLAELQAAKSPIRYHDPARIAHLVEKGHKGAPAKPHLFPAYRAKRAAALNKIKQKLREALIKESKS